MRKTLMPVFAYVSIACGIIGNTWFLVLIYYYFTGLEYTFNPVIR